MESINLIRDESILDYNQRDGSILDYNQRDESILDYNQKSIGEPARISSDNSVIEIERGTSDD
ncbi:hypothetical protein AMTR_s00022p00219250 [Amborella trichopoda]|uniref:Uncharacterized protein n=1 Tax=Amborella trichopoda TaxID=13333 RepID=W1PNU3_AMBTC|nr:hypothetical protein AMTR_s00022p00219250 [Amborella trichopoda]